MLKITVKERQKVWRKWQLDAWKETIKNDSVDSWGLPWLFLKTAIALWWKNSDLKCETWWHGFIL